MQTSRVYSIICRWNSVKCLFTKINAKKFNKNLGNKFKFEIMFNFHSHWMPAIGNLQSNNAHLDKGQPLKSHSAMRRNRSSISQRKPLEKRMEQLITYIIEWVLLDPLLPGNIVTGLRLCWSHTIPISSGHTHCNITSVTWRQLWIRRVRLAVRSTGIWRHRWQWARITRKGRRRWRWLNCTRLYRIVWWKMTVTFTCHYDVPFDQFRPALEWKVNLKRTVKHITSVSRNNICARSLNTFCIFSDSVDNIMNNNLTISF